MFGGIETVDESERLTKTCDLKSRRPDYFMILKEGRKEGRKHRSHASICCCHWAAAELVENSVDMLSADVMLVLVSDGHVRMSGSIAFKSHRPPDLPNGRVFDAGRSNSHGGCGGCGGCDQGRQEKR
ncbi:hypothetical protein HBH64_092680 [Parastagonospora nodorum]|nr:hypothetical protein HBH50_119250 [Parastagonospora nodorum]KAH4100413.1 hypothetical protein HBH48_020790 [Parastagonospora nodorum]KAH4299700.1 hypothetical protein HBI01_117240 [Parastagonospora nodorum]KAH4303918.1 hypothetical protein HBI02_130380 [Parastagonospora nodorum]KAH4329589.1 hypothetical protein HBI00_092340 [Parastagonospora nodorum]